MSLKRTVLVFLLDRSTGRILLIEKKRGMGAGKWNGPGGKLDEGESEEDGARRECREETGLTPGPLRAVGLLEFRFPQDSVRKSWDNLCRVFLGESYSGELIAEGEECRTFWWPVEHLDYEKFWPDDKFWLPDMLAGREFHRVYRFDRDDHLLSEERLI